MSFKLIRQKYIMECGPAALCMVCRHWGIKVSLTSVSEMCHAGKTGVSFLALKSASHNLGLASKTVCINVEKLMVSPLPCILHWNKNHFVVLYKIKKGTIASHTKFYIADPGKGKFKCQEKELIDNWYEASDNAKGYAMFLHPMEGERQRIENASSPRLYRTLTSSIKNLIAENRIYFIQIFLGLILGCILQLIFPFLTQFLIDKGAEKRSISLIWIILAGELLIILARTLTDFIRRWLVIHLSMRINLRLLNLFWIKLLRLPMAFFEKKLSGDILQRIADHSRLRDFISQQCLNCAVASISLVVFGIVLAYYNMRIFAIYCLFSLGYIGWILIFLRKRQYLDYSLFEAQAVNQNRTFQFVNAIQEIKLQNGGQRRLWEWQDLQADLFKLQLQQSKLQQIQDAGAIAINEVKNILLTGFAAIGVMEGGITIGIMVAIEFVIGQLNSPLIQIANLILSSQDMLISYDRINDVLSQREECPKGGVVLNNHTSENSSVAITLENVSFNYNPIMPTKIISEINLRIPPNSVTAIVGPSGSGKTTLLKLLLGYYDFYTGGIHINGVDLRDIDLNAWRHACGVVMQDGVVFSDTIGANIAVGQQQIEEEELFEAAEKAGISQFINSLPLKFETKIGAEGIELSKGQKQRLLIARALYKKPKILFMDEATNSLDATNEAMITHNLQDFYKGKTVVIIAHRLSTVINADQIVVIEGGKIKEIGTHHELLKKHAAYYNLIKHQLQVV